MPTSSARLSWYRRIVIVQWAGVVAFGLLSVFVIIQSEWPVEAGRLLAYFSTGVVVALSLIAIEVFSLPQKINKDKLRLSSRIYSVLPVIVGLCAALRLVEDKIALTGMGYFLVLAIGLGIHEKVRKREFYGMDLW